MKTIGILGGLGPESTIAYYSYITRQYYALRGDYAYPQIVVYSLTFGDFINVGYEAAEKVRCAIGNLRRAGADFVVAACNSIHIVYDEVSPGLPIPWVSIMDVTAERIKAKGLATIGLLGTVFTMTKGFFQTALDRYGIETLTPPPNQQKRINDIIYSELVLGDVRAGSREDLLVSIDDLKERGAQGVVLGCTELPFVLRQEHCDLPVFDTTALHAQKALDLALEET